MGTKWKCERESESGRENLLAVFVKILLMVIRNYWLLLPPRSLNERDFLNTERHQSTPTSATRLGDLFPFGLLLRNVNVRLLGLITVIFGVPQFLL